MISQKSISLLILTLLYFFIEVFINHILYNQLSSGSDHFTIEALELWGKIITGLGVALILLKILAATEIMHDRFFSSFVWLCIPGLIISFSLTTFIVNRIVNTAGQGVVNKSHLVLAAKSTLVPHYNFNMASYPTDNLEGLSTFEALLYPFKDKEKTTSLSYVTHKANFNVLAEKCSHIGEEKLGVNTSIDKAFFAISALNSPVDEKFYQSVIKDYYTCLYSDKEYRDNHSKGYAAPTDALKIMFNQYEHASYRYNQARKGVRDKSIRNKIDAEWRKEMNQYFGFKTKLWPNKHWDVFITSNDVKRLYMSRASKNAIYPFDKNYQEVFKEKIVETLPESVMPFYRDEETMAKHYESMSLMQQDDPMAFDNDVTILAGKKSYKAAILPVVAMGLSAFFLVFNVLILVFSILIRISPSVLIPFMVIAFGYLLILFPVHALNIETSDRTYVSGQNKKADWVYYNQRNIARLYHAYDAKKIKHRS